MALPAAPPVSTAWVRVLERFKRGEAGRTLPGNGLGLPLVAAIAQLHGFLLDLDDARLPREARSHIGFIAVTPGQLK